VPLIVLVLIGVRIMTNRRGLGFVFVFFGLALTWLGACTGSARLIQEHALRPPRALTPEAVQSLRTDAKQRPPSTAIVVLGAGRVRRADEYGVSNLTPASVERLRYGAWLAKETGQPLAFSGGVGWASEGESAEAEIASRIALREFNRPLRWQEGLSRDTHQNAVRTIAQLRPEGVQQIVLVTHAYHMPRARKLFEAEAQGSIKIVPAPLGFITPADRSVMEWLPSSRGFEAVNNQLHELIGLVVGA
jgi:uncharacterized SAM-binding protein YcdF (DUF218 family)